MPPAHTIRARSWLVAGATASPSSPHLRLGRSSQPPPPGVNSRRDQRAPDEDRCHEPAGDDAENDQGNTDHAEHDGTGTEGEDAAEDLDFMATPSDGFLARDASLPPLEESRVHRRTITVRDEIREVAPGVTQRQWTYDGTAPTILTTAS